jgi:hypothetical protein
VDRGYNEVINLAERVRNVNFSPLREQRIGYADQGSIPTDRVEMAAACMIHYGGEVASVVRFCDGEFTGAHRDPEEILRVLQPHIDKTDYDQIDRILNQGCPAKFVKFFSKANKLKMMKRGNCRSVDGNQEIVVKTMNKEDRNSHLISMPSILCRFSPYAHHVGQTMNLKKANARLCWDGSNKDDPLDWAVNDDVDMELEPLITFGNTKDLFFTDMYNLRIDDPEREYWIGTADVKACFRFPKLHPDITGAFSFMMGFMKIFFLMTAMVFGFKSSANSWEPFRRAIEIMSAVCFDNIGDDSTIHQEYVDMVNFGDLPSPDEKFTKAKPCSINKGYRDENGNRKATPARMYVDDALFIAAYDQMKRMLRAIVEAIFIVCGRPEVDKRQCPLAMDKWEGMTVGHHAILLGLLFNTRKLTVAMTKEYLDELRELLKTTWHEKRKSFTINELEKLLGKCARLGEASNWVYHLLTHLYSSAAFALRGNEEYLGRNSPSFIAHLKKIKELRQKEYQERNATDVAHINFAIKKNAQRIHRCKREYFIGKDMRAEINFLAQALDPETGVKWETPIAHMIKRDPSAQCSSDACLDAGGGWSVDLGFVWYLDWSKQIYKRTKKFVFDDRDKQLITINCLEFASVIINYCASLTVIETTDFTDDPWPILLAWCDNSTAVHWVNHACMNSETGRALGRLFCALLMDSRLGINAEWLSTHENYIADDISRLKKLFLQSNPTSQHPSIDYSIIFQKYPQLKTCKRFVPSEELISCLEHCLLQRSCPSLERINRLKQSSLGKLITFDG